MYRLGSRLVFVSRPPRPRGVPPVAGAGSCPRGRACSDDHLPSATAYRSTSSRLGPIKETELLALLRDEKAEEDRTIPTDINIKYPLKATGPRGMGPQLLPLGRGQSALFSSARACSLKRTFSSFIQNPPVIKQLMCHDDYEIKSYKWFPLHECLFEGSILKPINATGLIRPQDVIKFGPYETGILATHFLRQGSGLIAANLMRGVNVSPLMRIDNLLWSPQCKCLMFKECNLIGEPEDASCPYRALYETFNMAVEMTTGHKLKPFPHPLPPLLEHFLDYLLDASITDKRLITGHSVTRFPGERIEQNRARNHLLRRRFKYEFEWPASSYVDPVLADIGSIFPDELLTPEGMHPAIDYWARHAQQLRDEFSLSPVSCCPVVVPRGVDGTELRGFRRRVALGKILVALLRDPFEHPFEPSYNFWHCHYDLVHIENLTSNFFPLYGPKSDKACLELGLSGMLDTDPGTKAPYYYYTDVNWVEKEPPSIHLRIGINEKAKAFKSGFMFMI